MPAVEIAFFKDDDGTTPVLEWLKEVRKRERRAFAKCVVKLSRLGRQGYELRRPESAYLRDGIYELRIRFGSVNYRILYFFHDAAVCVLAHALTKEDKVPDIDIERALARKAKYEREPEGHKCYEAI